MNPRIIFFIVVFLTTACASQNNIANKSVFTFTSEGTQYQIVSINSKSGEGTNFLIQVDDNGHPVKLARDLDQDGTLDLILKVRELTLPKANIIYNEGINKAKSSGSYRERTVLRTFEVTKDNYIFTIKTYLIENSSPHSLFVMYNLEDNSESIFMDSKSDGKLDYIEKGTISLKDANTFYTNVLKEGILKKKIDYDEGIYTVKKVQSL